MTILTTIPRHAAAPYPWLPPDTDPYAEGARAARAGLAAEDNPYLWPPGAGELWLAGFMGETK